MNANTHSSACKIVVLISGGGSNLQSLIDSIQAGQLNAQISAVLSNRSDAFGLERAQRVDIPTTAIDHRQFDSREAFDAQLMHAIDRHQPDLVILAGFMRILSVGFVQHYQGRLLNIHPSLLPKYPGLHTHQRAIDAGDTEAGATVHFVTEQLDGGPTIAQATVAIEDGDSADSLAQRILIKEHQLYPQVAQWFAQGRLSLANNQVLMDGNIVPPQGYQ